jgi:poly-gamma-glutamate synthase PgsB/CapB
VTNVRLDHREEMGNTRPDVARSLSSAVRRGAKVFLPADAQYPEFEHAARHAGAEIIRLPSGQARSFEDEDRRLAVSVAAHLGVVTAVALRGISAATPDYGSLKAWEAELGASRQRWVLVSAFAANEPESTGLILDHVQKKLSLDGRPLVGVLNFRADRGDRTRQWLEAHRQGFFAGFRNVYVVGAHVHSLRLRKKDGLTPALVPLPERSPAEIMDRISSVEKAGCVLVGCGNIGGLGGRLLEFWRTIGRPLAI